MGQGWLQVRRMVFLVAKDKVSLAALTCAPRPISARQNHCIYIIVEAKAKASLWCPTALHPFHVKVWMLRTDKHALCGSPAAAVLCMYKRSTSRYVQEEHGCAESYTRLL